MEILEKKLADIRPYEKNPRKNDAAVDPVAESIKQFGFKVPIVIDKDGVIVCGHTRYKAAKKLKLKTVPCIMADDLTPEQIRAFRLADNKVGELAEWDLNLLTEELLDLKGIDLDWLEFENDDGYEKMQAGFKERMESGELSEDDEEYQEFLEKFQQKKTTDDCYTPTEVYDALADFVANRYGLSKSNFVRPFYPGGDYQSFNYGTNDVVVDNPPFSIMAEILSFYDENKIKYFLFAPSLTILGSTIRHKATAFTLQVTVIYENGATVATSFLTNLEPEEIAALSCPELYQIIKDAVERSKTVKAMPKYEYPLEVFTAAMGSRFSKYGVDFRVYRNYSKGIAEIESQKEQGKQIYGCGYLLDSTAAAEKAAAEKAAAEKAAATRWKLSDAERAVIAELDKKRKAAEDGESRKTSD